MIAVAAKKRKNTKFTCEISSSIYRGAALDGMLFYVLRSPAFTKHEQLRYQLLTWPRMHDIQVMPNQEMHVMLSLCVQIELQRARGASVLCGLWASCYMCFLPSPGGPSCQLPCLLLYMLSVL